MNREVATPTQVADLQATLLACVIALDNLPTDLGVAQFKIAAKEAVELAYRTLPGGTVEDRDKGGGPSGMCAGWVNLGEPDPHFPQALDRLRRSVNE